MRNVIRAAETLTQNEEKDIKWATECLFVEMMIFHKKRSPDIRVYKLVFNSWIQKWGICSKKPFGMSSDSKASKTGGKQGTRAPSGPQERTLRDMRTGRTKKDSARTQEDAERQRLLTLPPLYSTVQQSTVQYSRRTDTPWHSRQPHQISRGLWNPSIYPGSIYYSPLRAPERLSRRVEQLKLAPPRPDTGPSRGVSTTQPSVTRSTRPVQQKHGTHVPTPTPWT